MKKIFVSLLIALSLLYTTPVFAVEKELNNSDVKMVINMLISIGAIPQEKISIVRVFLTFLNSDIEKTSESSSNTVSIPENSIMNDTEIIINDNLPNNQSISNTNTVLETTISNPSLNQAWWVSDIDSKHGMTLKFFGATVTPTLTYNIIDNSLPKELAPLFSSLIVNNCRYNNIYRRYNPSDLHLTSVTVEKFDDTIIADRDSKNFPVVKNYGIKLTTTPSLSSIYPDIAKCLTELSPNYSSPIISN